MADISRVHGGYKPTCNWGGHHLCLINKVTFLQQNQHGSFCLQAHLVDLSGASINKNNLDQFGGF